MDSFKKFIAEGVKDWWHGKPTGYHASSAREIYDKFNPVDKQQVDALMNQSGAGMANLSFDDAVAYVQQMQKSTSVTRQAMSYQDPTARNPFDRGYSRSSKDMLNGPMPAKDLTSYISPRK
jgi:hypothetical protein